MPAFHLAEWDADKMGMNEIPLVDLSCFAPCDNYEERLPERLEVAAQLREACKSIGFFYVKGHGMSNETIHGAFQAAHDFFALPQDVKDTLHVQNNPLWRGYTGVGGQSCRTDEDKPDLKETFTVGEEGTEGMEKSPLHGPNQWPDETQCPGFSTLLKKYHKEIYRVVAMRILRALAVSLNQEEEYFTRQSDNAVANLALLYYPHDPSIVNEDEKRQGCGAHTDWGFMTMLVQDSEGLQVLHKDGRWIHAPPIQDAFLVNIGNMAARWTANLYKSTVHRVYNMSSTRSRISIPFFITPNYDTKIVTFPDCAEETGNHYPPFKCGDYIMKQLGLMYHETEEAGMLDLDEPAERARLAALKKEEEEKAAAKASSSSS
jgi:isopenicillin N synthase-like dioxygenase